MFQFIYLSEGNVCSKVYRQSYIINSDRPCDNAEESLGKNNVSYDLKKNIEGTRNCCRKFNIFKKSEDVFASCQIHVTLIFVQMTF